MDGHESGGLHLLLEHQEAGLQIAIATVDLIVDAANQALYNHYLDTRIPAIVSSDTLDDILERLQERIRAEPVPIESDLNPIWLPESEPIPIPIDVQATGMIPIRVRPAPEPEVAEPSGDGRESTVSSGRRSISKRSVARRSSSRPEQPIITTPPPVVIAPESRRIPPEVEERERFRELHIKRLARPNPATTPAAARIETDPATAELNRVLELTGGRPYMYDSHGAPVVIAPIKPDRLPALMALVEVTVPPETPTPVPAAVVVADKKKPRPRRDKKPNASAAAAAAAWFRPASDAQPTVAQAIVPAPGVTFKDGSTVKSGAKRSGQLSVDQMTLAEYRAYLEQQELTETKAAVVTDLDLSTVKALPTVRAPTPSRPASPTARFNEQLIKDPGWGVSPHEGVKPAVVSRPVNHGSRTASRTPRTRPFIETITIKRHLSHPMYPRSRGHTGRVPGADGLCNEKSSVEKVRKAARDQVQYPKRIEKRGQPTPRIFTTPLAKALFGCEPITVTQGEQR